jgi:transcriptional regulator with PAS, ATPase and Fis domain
VSYQLAARDPETLVDAEVALTRSNDAFSTLVGDSQELRDVIHLARRISARGGSNVLLIGETGTGKEVFARAIHAASPRGNAPFVAVNCAAIPAQLLESELFGYERGAFTDARQKKQGLLELARDGTLFLDEISSLPLDLQPKLLRSLEERRVRRVGGFDEIEIRCRVTAATNVPLEELVEAGLFREDLFYRLNVLRLVIPPLRQREGDIMRLAQHFLRELAAGQGLPSPRLSSSAMATLKSHSWPGNVRELKNVLERALVTCEGGEIDFRHLAMGGRGTRRVAESGTAGGVIEVPSAGRSLKSVEAELVRLTLELTRGNKSAAARMLGISRPTLHRKLEDQALVAAT